jgi:hypothetical protein
VLFGSVLGSSDIASKEFIQLTLFIYRKANSEVIVEVIVESSGRSSWSHRGGHRGGHRGVIGEVIVELSRENVSSVGNIQPTTKKKSLIYVDNVNPMIYVDNVNHEESEVSVHMFFCSSRSQPINWGR